MIDDTVFDSFKNGIIVTKDCLFVKESLYDTYTINLCKETTVQLDEEKKLLVNGKEIFKFDAKSLAADTFVRGLKCLIAQLDSQGQSMSALECKISQIVLKKFYTAPNIPKDKLANAMAEYASDVKAEDVLGVFDCSVTGNAKKGVLITKNAVYANTMLNPLAKIKKAILKDMLSMHSKKKFTVSPEDVITVKGSDIWINDDILCSLIAPDDKEFLPYLVDILNIMKTN